MCVFFCLCDGLRGFVVCCVIVGEGERRERRGRVWRLCGVAYCVFAVCCGVCCCVQRCVYVSDEFVVVVVVLVFMGVLVTTVVVCRTVVVVGARGYVSARCVCLRFLNKNRFLVDCWRNTCILLIYSAYLMWSKRRKACMLVTSRKKKSHVEKKKKILHDFHCHDEDMNLSWTQSETTCMILISVRILTRGFSPLLS